MTLRTFVLLVCCVVVCGCTSKSLRPPRSSNPLAGNEQLTRAQLGSEVMSLADTYSNICAQSLEQLRRSTKRAEVAEWAMTFKVAVALGSFANATGPNAAVNLVDMIVHASLRRAALEEHWIPTLLHDEGAPVLEAFKAGERHAWQAGEKALTTEQLAELRRLIDQWRVDHPKQYILSHVRFAEFASERGVSDEPESNTQPSNIFGLLYLDPLSNLDPVAREIRSARELVERIVFLAERLPMVVGWQFELNMSRVLAQPAVTDFVGSAGRFADASEKFGASSERLAESFKGYPAAFDATMQQSIAKLSETIATQRQAAIDQISQETTRQREGLAKDIAAIEPKLRDAIDHAGKLVERMEKASVTMKSGAQDVVQTGEGAGARTLDHAFRLALILLIVLLVGLPVSLLTYRWIAKRAQLSRGKPFDALFDHR